MLTLARTAARLSTGCERLGVLVRNASLFDAGQDREEVAVLAGLPDGVLPDTVAPPRDRLSAMHYGACPDDAVADHAAPARAALNRGALVRLLYPDSAVHHRGLVAVLRGLTDLGGQVRFGGPLPFGLVLVDRSGAVCRLPGTDPLLLHGRRAVGLLGQVFESCWAQALPLDRAPASRSAGPSGAGLTPVHESILRLMAEGATDEAIARTLGVTSRTVARRLREIYRVFGTQSRFRAGLIAADLGIV